uniref:Uncharacterized protein n=1 Tax=Panagrellus redivivus TaxID=6233 RepID=A0A7E4ZSI5_PANRE
MGSLKRAHPGLGSANKPLRTDHQSRKALAAPGGIIPVDSGTSTLSSYFMAKREGTASGCQHASLNSDFSGLCLVVDSGIECKSFGGNWPYFLFVPFGRR